MLVFDPKKRIDASRALAHSYVGPYHDPTDEPIAHDRFDWSFNDADLPVDNWKVMMYSEILGMWPTSPFLINRSLSFPLRFPPNGKSHIWRGRHSRRCTRRTRRHSSYGLCVMLGKAMAAPFIFLLLYDDPYSLSSFCIS